MARLGTTLRPRCWLGAPSPFGLALPEAAASPATLYAPRGVCLTDTAVVVADTGNHRVLVWDEPLPRSDHRAADGVVGQPDLHSEGPKLLFLPTGLLVTEDGRFVVADAWHHRILVWDDLGSARSGARPRIVLGQPGPDDVGEGCGPQRFYWPFGIAMVAGAFFVADTGNRRVLGWLEGVPEPGQPADVVLGQPDLASRGENRDGPVRADSLRWPHALASVAGYLAVADAGNHRVLAWRLPLDADRPADVVLGQQRFTTADESPYRPPGAGSLRFPYAVAGSDDGRLFVADTANNRIGVLEDAAATFGAAPVGGALDLVLGQPDFDGNGENRWQRVAADSLSWPYGLSLRGGELAIADSGNNRVVIWGEATTR